MSRYGQSGNLMEREQRNYLFPLLHCCSSYQIDFTNTMEPRYGDDG